MVIPWTTVAPLDCESLALVDAVAVLVTESILMTPPMSILVILLSADAAPSVSFSTDEAIVSALPKVKPACPSAPFMTALALASNASACAFKVAAWPSRLLSGLLVPLRASARTG